MKDDELPGAEVCGHISIEKLFSDIKVPTIHTKRFPQTTHISPLVDRLVYVTKGDSARETLLFVCGAINPFRTSRSSLRENSVSKAATIHFLVRTPHYKKIIKKH